MLQLLVWIFNTVSRRTVIKKMRSEGDSASGGLSGSRTHSWARREE